METTISAKVYFVTPLFCIMAVTNAGVIGNKGDLPFKKNLALDKKWFMTTTKKQQSPEEGSNMESVMSIVIMGRKTYDSIPEQYRPLKGRRNFVITSQGPDSQYVKELGAAGVLAFPSLTTAMLAIDKEQNPYTNVFVIGGKALYEEALASPRCERIYLTRVAATDGQVIEGDVSIDTSLLPPPGFKPDVEDPPAVIDGEGMYTIKMFTYRKVVHA